MTTGRRRFTLALALLASLGGLHAPPAVAQVGLATPLNNVASSLAAPHAAGSGTLDLKSGEGSLFGTPTPSAPVRVTVARKNTLVNNQIVQGSAYTIFMVTGRTADQLTGCTAVEGTADRTYAKNDPVVVAITAGTILDLQGAIATLPVDTAVVHKSVAETITGGKTHAPVLPNVNPFGDNPAIKVVQKRTGAGPGGSTTSVGDIAIGVVDSTQVFPYGYQFYVGDTGGVASGRTIMSSQKRYADGRIQGLAFAAAGGARAGGMFEASTDGNYACLALEAWLVGNPNGYAISVRDYDDIDPVSDFGPYSRGTGRNKWVVGPQGQQLWGTDLGQTDPETTKYAKLYFNTLANGWATTTGSLTLEGNPSAGFPNYIDLTSTASGGKAGIRFGAGGNNANSSPFTVRTVVGSDTYLQVLSGELTSVAEFRATGFSFAGTNATLTTAGVLTLPGIALGVNNPTGDGTAADMLLGGTSPTVAANYRRKNAGGSIYFGENSDTGAIYLRGGGGVQMIGTKTSDAFIFYVSNAAGGATANTARLALAPQGGFGPTNAPYIEAFNVGASDGGVRWGTYNGAVDGLAERMRLSHEGNLGLGGFTFGGGRQVMFIGNAAVVPTANPSGGGLLYAEGGALKWRSPAGTITTVAPNLVLPLVLWGLRRRFGRLAA